MYNWSPQLNVLNSSRITAARPNNNFAHKGTKNIHENKSKMITNVSPEMHSKNHTLTPVHEEYELLEYEWPDLPQLKEIRDALARGRISRGVDYLLPVDKAKNSVEGEYRTNLRAMFKESYLRDTDNYNEEKVLHYAKHHFDTNSSSTINRPKYDLFSAGKTKINQDSERHRNIFVQSAPSHGIVGRDTDISNLRQRSSLNFPQKQQLPPEALKLKEEAERILKSVQEKDQDQDEEYDPAIYDRQIMNEQAMGKYRKSPDKRRPVNSRRSLPSREMMKNLSSRGRPISKTKSAKFRSYDELKNSEVPLKREIPSRLRSRYMSDSRSESVWDWLNKKEKITDFTYFLEICS